MWCKVSFVAILGYWNLTHMRQIKVLKSSWTYVRFMQPMGADAARRLAKCSDFSWQGAFLLKAKTHSI